MKIAQVQFQASCTTELALKKYSYRTGIETLKKGNEVVVETKWGLKVAVFQNYVPENDEDNRLKATAWIVQKINTDEVEQLKALEDFTSVWDNLEKNSLIQVRDTKSSVWLLAYFSHARDNKIYTFPHGRTSHTSKGLKTEPFRYAEIVEAKE
ncbi:hypothetical protein H7E67_01345 [Clostridium gasigenes]|uniref:hypothetical protein n=1 Tax=Clostridium gasigenes TaxID=94869 RepID=UPI001626149F|nr:hypothetical protein [Clostridium gasigenes]MBB6622064.1 hypothetical protein [Clostridium gasigenes]